MPKITVEKSTHIEAPIQTVFETVRNLRGWKNWSPWVIAEADCPLSYDDDGKGYSWDGKIIGSGKMQVTGEDAPRSIDLQLNFIKPWKSQSAVRFSFAERDGGTEVTWTMDGSIPFFMFFMKSMMVCFIGMDYERGLMMLKAKLETGSVPSKLGFDGTARFEGASYLGVRSRSSFEEIGTSMGEAMEQLKAALDEKGIEPSGTPFSIYHKWAASKGYTEFTVGVPVASAPSDVPAGLTAGEIPACDTYRVEHTGPYPFLGNAWSAAMMHARAKQFRMNKKVAPFEIYQNEPGKVADEELVAVVHMPAK